VIDAKRIEDAIGDAVIAQNILDLANKEGTNLDDVATLLEKEIDTHQIKQWLQDSVKLDGAATLLNQAIACPVVTQLINNTANLRDIATNAQILLDRDVRIDLINGWLKNGTHLNDAIAIIDQGVDLNLIGTSSTVGDFTGLTGVTPNEVVSRIPKDAMIEHWTPNPKGAQKGMRFYWKDPSYKAWRVRMHDPDPSAPAWSNAARGWVLRIRHSGKFMDADGTFYTENAIKNPNSDNYDPANADKTHIPIQAP
jgi:hypothetical protein